MNQGVYVIVDDGIDAHFERARTPAPRSCASSTTPTTARATTSRATPRATSGASGPTGPSSCAVVSCSACLRPGFRRGPSPSCSRISRGRHDCSTSSARTVRRSAHGASADHPRGVLESRGCRGRHTGRRVLLRVPDRAERPRRRRGVHRRLVVRIHSRARRRPHRQSATGRGGVRRPRCPPRRANRRLGTRRPGARLCLHGDPGRDRAS